MRHRLNGTCDGFFFFTNRRPNFVNLRSILWLCERLVPTVTQWQWRCNQWESRISEREDTHLSIYLSVSQLDGHLFFFFVSFVCFFLSVGIVAAALLRTVGSVVLRFVPMCTEQKCQSQSQIQCQCQCQFQCHSKSTHRPCDNTQKLVKLSNHYFRHQKTAKNM